MLSSNAQIELEEFFHALLIKYAFRRRDEDVQAIISSSNPITLDYKERRYLYLFSPVSLTITAQDYGTFVLPASTWGPLPFPERTRLFAAAQGPDQIVFLRATDDVIPFAASTAVLGPSTNNIGNVGLLTGTNPVGNIGALGLPVGATQINANGTATAGTATATLTGAAGKFTYLTGWSITIVDTATGGAAELSISGVNGGPLLYEIDAQGVANASNPYGETLTTPLQSTAVNTSIVLNLPTLGAGTGKVSVVAHGYLL